MRWCRGSQRCGSRRSGNRLPGQCVATRSPNIKTIITDCLGLVHASFLCVMLLAHALSYMPSLWIIYLSPVFPGFCFSCSIFLFRSFMFLFLLTIGSFPLYIHLVFLLSTLSTFSSSSFLRLQTRRTLLISKLCTVPLIWLPISWFCHVIELWYYRWNR